MASIVNYTFCIKKKTNLKSGIISKIDKRMIS